MMQPLVMFYWLVVGHCVADYPLQGELWRAKNKNTPVAGIPWWIGLCAHAVIQGGFVAFITGSVLLGLAETVAHAAIDYTKCMGKLTMPEDQLIHITCKAMWVVVAYLLMHGGAIWR